MFAKVIRLQYWKSEHNEAMCEDAYADDTAHGLFVVADGAGTTLFSNIWARVLVKHFLRVPLLNNDPFEVEWWVRHAQELYRLEVPTHDKLDWNARQKAQNQGSHSTLATVRLAQVSETEALAELLVFGDSCVFLHSARSNELAFFPLQKAEDFDRAPICISSKLSLFNRYFHSALTRQLHLEAGDTLLLATDAVSRWIISGGGDRYPHPLPAFQELIVQTPETWANFIKNNRTRDKIVDDDSTALLVRLSDTQAHNLSLPIGSTSQHNQEIRLLRKKAFEQAMQAQNSELVAIYYGDGADLKLEGVQLSQEYIEQVRRVADAMQEMLFVLRQELNGPGSTKIKGVWQKYEQVLATESCADNLRQTLQRIGVIAPPQIVVPENIPPSLSAEPALPEGEVPTLQQIPRQIEKPADKYVLDDIQREREQIELQNQLFQALFADDDEAILAAHQAILQSPGRNGVAAFSLSAAQRIEQAKKRSEVRHFIQQAIDNRVIEQMSNAYDIVRREQMAYSEEVLQRLELAYQFNLAYLKNDDGEIVKAYEHILHSPYRNFFAYTPSEEERVTNAWNAISQSTSTMTSREANAPTISENWFRKICIVKHAYLRYKFGLQFAQDQIEYQALEDVGNDQSIQEGIEEFNLRLARRGRLDPQAELAGELKRLKSAPEINNYEAFLQVYGLTEEEVKAILLIFLRREALEGYLRKVPMQLHDWLEMHKRGNTAHHEDQSEFNGWKGE